MVDEIRTALLYTDAGARGNPGPAAIAYRVVDNAGNLLESRAEFVGIRTCNEAEYDALIAGLKAIVRLAIPAVRVVSDSDLMVQQLKGTYRVRSARLADLFAEARTLMRAEFGHATIEHRRRDDAGLAACDQMVNSVLEAQGFPKQPPTFRRRRPP